MPPYNDCISCRSEMHMVSLCQRDGMADETDSKSVGRNTVWVRVPRLTPIPTSQQSWCLSLSGRESGLQRSWDLYILEYEH